MLEHLTQHGFTARLELVSVDRGGRSDAARDLGREHDVEVRRVGWDDKQPVFRPIRHAWRVEVAHGRLGRSRRLAKSFEDTTTSATGWLQVACIAPTLGHLSRGGHAGSQSISRPDPPHGPHSPRQIWMLDALQQSNSRRSAVAPSSGRRWPAPLAPGTC
jgi:hypothetical protein